MAARPVDTVGRLGSGAWRAVAGIFAEEDEPGSLAATAHDCEVTRCCEQAQALCEEGNLAKASGLLEYVVEQYPEEIEARLQLAVVHQEAGRVEQAAAAVDAALDVAPENVEALLLKAQLAERQGNVDRALEQYDRVLAVSPGNVTAQLRVADLELASRRPERAAPLLRAVAQAIQATRDERVEAMWRLGFAYSQDGRWPEAAQALAMAAPHRPQMGPDDWYLLAAARLHAGDTEGAARDLRHALQMAPQHAQATAMHEKLRRQIAVEAQREQPALY